MFTFYVSAKKLRHTVAKLRKIESRAKRISFFFYAETE